MTKDERIASYKYSVLQHARKTQKYYLYLQDISDIQNHLL